MDRYARSAAIMAGLNFASYLAVTFNLRVNAQGLYLPTFLSAFALALLGFTIFKRIADAGGKAQCFAYAVGGAFGDIAGIWITKHLFGH